VDRSLRAARQSGLTSPDPVRAPTPQGTPTPDPDPQTTDEPHKRASSRTPTPAFTCGNRSWRKDWKALPENNRWIQA